MKQILLFTPKTLTLESTLTPLAVQAPLPPPFDSLPILLPPVVQGAVFGGTAPWASPKHPHKGDLNHDI